MTQPFDEINLNSTGTLQMVATFDGTPTNMDEVLFTLTNPNLVTVVGPITLTNVSTGVYQYPIPIGMLSLLGNWTHTWYIQRLTQSLQETKVLKVTQ